MHETWFGEKKKTKKNKTKQNNVQGGQLRNSRENGGGHSLQAEINQLQSL
jgi:hypothetical protein